MKVLQLMFLFFTVLICLSCKKKQAPPLFQLVADSGVNFENNVEDGKLDNSFLFRNFYNGGGVATGDINNDGLADLFLTSNSGENKLYLNKGDFNFEDISAKAKITKDNKWYTGVVFVDLNSDGWLDIYICSSGHMSTGNRKSKLYINNRDLSFTEAAAEYGLDISAYTTQVSFFDYDLDGDLDCFMINNSPIPVNQLNFSNLRSLPEKQWNVGEFLKGGGDHLYRNDNGLFKEVTYETGIHGSLISFGLGVSVGDINDDGYPDIYVSNDSYEREYLYINQKNGTFKDEF
ncbi:MAG TPA: FG-GAP and VCBS repeat-containing protein, partial [Chitinophagaceae bacterium]|nr:FG-GAP and VCBS repeat-containing protein [Chitinophagaceae bacterium]